MAAEPQLLAGGGALGEERKKLKKVLHRFDLVFFTIAAFISLDTIARDGSLRRRRDVLSGSPSSSSCT